MSIRIYLLAGSFCLLLLALISCAKSDNSGTTTPAPITSVPGAYKVTSGTITPAVVGSTDIVALASVYTNGNCLTEAVVTFAASGTITNSNPTACQSANAQTLITNLGLSNGGKWVFAGTTLTITYGTNQTRVFATSFSGQTMILRGTLANNPVDGSPGNFSYVLVLTRQ